MNQRGEDTRTAHWGQLTAARALFKTLSLKLRLHRCRRQVLPLGNPEARGAAADARRIFFFFFICGNTDLKRSRSHQLLIPLLFPGLPGCLRASHPDSLSYSSLCHVLRSHTGSQAAVSPPSAPCHTCSLYLQMRGIYIYFHL